MRTTLVIAVPFLLFGFVSTVSADCVGPTVMGKCLSGTTVQGHGSDSSYQGSSGKSYDYNMSNPVDRNRYSTDSAAQIRDQRDGMYSPDRSRDQSRGQYGGGYRPN